MNKNLATVYLDHEQQTVLNGIRIGQARFIYAYSHLISKSGAAACDIFNCQTCRLKYSPAQNSGLKPTLNENSCDREEISKVLRTRLTGINEYFFYFCPL